MQKVRYACFRKKARRKKGKVDVDLWCLLLDVASFLLKTGSVDLRWQFFLVKERMKEQLNEWQISQLEL